MRKNLKDKEEQIYMKLLELKKGSLRARSLAFDCIGILGNESNQDSLEEKLNKVEKLLNEYSDKNNLTK